MLKAGKHVLCEKPMAINLKQCREILKVAKESGRFFMEVGDIIENKCTHSGIAGWGLGAE